MRILIAEDDLTSRLMLQAVLGKFGYDVSIAKDGEEAWKILQQPDAPKLIVLDRVMPGMDGLTLCRNLRAQHHPEPFYILLLTSKSEPNDIVQGLEAGADDYIAKPFYVVSGYSEMLLEDLDENDPHAETIRTIKTAVDKIGDLTRKIMHITQYRTKDYLGGRHTIIDIKESSSS
jgi:CheY-like chemotaxis protein